MHFHFLTPDLQKKMYKQKQNEIAVQFRDLGWSEWKYLLEKSKNFE
jgi:hypothetical protein